MIARISEFFFGTLKDGRAIKKFILRNASGAEATFFDLGASWVGFKLNADQPSLVLGCDTIEAFESQQASLGATTGRFANRIANGQFQLDGTTIQLDQNLPPHCLHGGTNNLSTKVWHSHITLLNNQTPTLTFTCSSADGECGFPGNLDVKVVITLTEENEVRFEYSAQTDRKTVINLTNHSYFNLDGANTGNINSHQFKITSDHYLEADNTGLPTGKVVAGKQTPMDFLDWRNASEQLNPITNPVLDQAEGYDHCYVFEQDRKLRLVASARSDRSNTLLECRTDLPGMQFYTANFLAGTPINSDATYKSYGAFCFEPGFWPDSPNHSHFPDCFIDSSNDFTAIIAYSFKQLDFNHD